jgi:hypothetical protein
VEDRYRAIIRPNSPNELRSSLMRRCHKLALLLLLALHPRAEAHIVPYTGEDPDAVTIDFKSGSATFNLSKGVVQTIIFHVGDKSYSVSLSGCTALEHVVFDSAVFDVGQPVEEGLFVLTFDAGAEDARAFGKLPRVQVSFNHGRPNLLLIARAVAKDGYFSSPLCPNSKTGS